MDPAIQKRLHRLFREESEELVAALNRGLVALEATSDPSMRETLIHDLFRHAHTLKGAAQSAGIRPVASVCHELEERFDALRRSPAAVDPQLLASLFELVDAIEAAAPAPPAPPQTSAQGPGGGSAARPRRSGESIRVLTPKLETLLEHASELLTAEQGLGQLLDAVQDVGRDEVRRASRSLRQAGVGLQNSARALRMAPFTYACEGLERLARDVAAASGKQVRLEVVGGDVELDRPILEALHEPLGHLVRNAIDHGIEPPDRRAAAGKPAQGRVSVEARLHGGRVQVDVRDDGAGVDLAAVRAAGASSGLELAEGESLAALFSPGFSTTQTVTETSGRGVGLDAVRGAVEGLGGTVELDSQPGVGATVGMLLPLTLAAVRVVLVEVAGQRYALTSSTIDRVARVDAEAITVAEGRQRLVTDEGPVPLMALAEILGLPETGEPAEHFPVVLAATRGQQVALEVDALGAELEITLSGLGERLAGIPAALGGALLPDGSPVVVLSPTACARLGMASGQTSRARQDEAATRALRVLLADDSLTTRTLERAILEGAGFEVAAAGDGEQALDLAANERFDVVVSDVAMPRLDGIGLCERLRASPRHADVPIILVTARATDEDRLRGLEAGANAYLTKQSFDQGELLATIAQLAGSP